MRVSGLSSKKLTSNSNPEYLTLTRPKEQADSAPRIFEGGYKTKRHLTSRTRYIEKETRQESRANDLQVRSDIEWFEKRHLDKHHGGKRERLIHAAAAFLAYSFSRGPAPLII